MKSCLNTNSIYSAHEEVLQRKQEALNCVTRRNDSLALLRCTRNLAFMAIAGKCPRQMTKGIIFIDHKKEAFIIQGDKFVRCRCMPGSFPPDNRIRNVQGSSCESRAERAAPVQPRGHMSHQGDNETQLVSKTIQADIWRAIILRIECVAALLWIPVQGIWSFADHVPDA